MYSIPYTRGQAKKPWHVSTLGGTNGWEMGAVMLFTCLKNISKNNVEVAWYWNRKWHLLVSVISRLFCWKGWSNNLVNWSDLFQKMVKVTLRLKWFKQVTKGQIYQPYLSTPLVYFLFLPPNQKILNIIIWKQKLSYTLPLWYT